MHGLRLERTTVQRCPLRPAAVNAGPLKNLFWVEGLHRACFARARSASSARASQAFAISKSWSRCDPIALLPICRHSAACLRYSDASFTTHAFRWAGLILMLHRVRDHCTDPLANLWIVKRLAIIVLGHVFQQAITGRKAPVLAYGRIGASAPPSTPHKPNICL